MKNIYRSHLKRSFDIAGSGLGLAVLGLPVLTLAFACAAIQGTSPFYCQKRIGRNQDTFTIYKIKTMKDGIGPKVDGIELPSMDRITRVGKFLRKSKIDELPQLINILKGDMSFVGPRPVTKLNTALAADKKRHTVRPGLTGLAQISNSQTLPVAERIRLDHEYVDKLSFTQDLKTLLLTPKRILDQANAPLFGDFSHLNKKM